MAKNLIIGAIDNYNWDQIKFWANSIKKNVPNADKAVIAYNMDKEVAERLVDEGFQIFGFDHDSKGNLVFGAQKDSYNVCVARFAHYYQFLSQLEEKPRFVLATDVRDVVFQKDPFTDMENVESVSGSSIYIASENLYYKDEPWSRNNMLITFGRPLAEKMANQPVYCAGVLGGLYDDFIDLCLNTFLLCRGQSPFTPGGGGPDQSALNVLLSLRPYNSLVYRFSTADNWTLHCGTTVEAIVCGSGMIGEEYARSELNIEDVPFINSFSFPEDYAILHQYDRISTLKEKIESLYGDN